MDRRLQRDQQLEGTAKPKGNAVQAGPRPWELEKYIYQESSTDDGRPSHSDPRLELAQRIHSQHQDSAFIPSDDDDSEYGYPAFGSGFTSHLDASGSSSASEWGTLAGGGLFSRDPVMQDYKKKLKQEKPKEYKARQNWVSFQRSHINKEVARQKKDSKKSRNKIGQG
jgi:hypothetical protein